MRNAAIIEHDAEEFLSFIYLFENFRKIFLLNFVFIHVERKIKGKQVFKNDDKSKYFINKR